MGPGPIPPPVGVPLLGPFVQCVGGGFCSHGAAVWADGGLKPVKKGEFIVNLLLIDLTNLSLLSNLFQFKW